MSKIDPKLARKFRTRARLRRVANDRPRLAVHRSSQHIYAQVIDDHSARTLAAASTLDPSLKGELKSGGFRRPSVARELQLGPRLFRGGGEAELRRYRELKF